MPLPGAPLIYTSYDGATLTLYPWTGSQIAVLTTSNSLDPNVMEPLLDALDRAFDVYAYITGREPALFRNHEGLLTIAQVPTTFGTNGGALGWLGSTGIELSQDVWTRLYNGVAQSGQFDQAVFYELGRNFWFYEAQLGAIDPFVTGFAIVNRFISMEQANLPGGPFNGGLNFSEFKRSILEDLTQTYLSNGSYTLENTIAAGGGVSSPNKWGAAELAASFLDQVSEDFGLEAYRDFYQVLGSLPQASTDSAVIQNFLDAARQATGIDYGFLDKDAGVSYVTGGRGNDALFARSDGSPVFGFGGTDTIKGGAAGDVIFGDNGNDSLSGEGGDDFLIGGWGIDRLHGGADRDLLYGGPGNDIINGGGGADTLIGGTGDDTYYVGNGGDVISEKATEGHDRVKSTVSYTLGANIENLALTTSSAINGTGNDLANAITGNSAANTLKGSGGNDTLKGVAGGDTLDGGVGNDFLYGGAGNDVLTGGSGIDYFYFNTVLSASTNVDRITDFSVVNDTIRLDDDIFTAAGPLGKLSAGAYHAGTAAHDSTDRIIYDSSTGNIYYDPDGNGTAAHILFARVGAGLVLTNSDFFIVG